MKHFGLFALPALLALGGCFVHSSSSDYSASTTIHRTFPAAAIQRLKVSNVSGPIRVTAWARPEISVDATVRARDADALHRITVDMTTQGSELSIKTNSAGGSIFNFGDEGEVEYAIHAPAAIAVKIANVSGDVAVERMHGGLSVADVSGAVNADGVEGSLDLSTTSGAITASVVTVKPGQRTHLTSVSGDIEVTVPKKAGLDVTASSVSGDFSSNFSLPSQEKTVGTSVNGAVNGGGAAVTFSTVSGSMTLTGK